MVQKIPLTLEIDDAALDAAQAKADKLIATLKQAEALAGALGNVAAIDCDDFADRIAIVKALAKEKPPEGGKSTDEMAARIEIVKALAQNWNVDAMIEQVAHEMFKPPD